jgi:hypothetical protein
LKFAVISKPFSASENTHLLRLLLCRCHLPPCFLLPSRHSSLHHPLEVGSSRALVCSRGCLAGSLSLKFSLKGGHTRGRCGRYLDLQVNESKVSE